MTQPFTLLTGPLNPSLSDLNSMINTLNALFANVTAAGDSAVAGNLAVTGTSTLTGNTAITGTLTVTGLTTLNGGLAGGASANIAINTNKFTVAASTGNTLIAGTLAVTGATALTGATTVTGNLTSSAHTARSVDTTLTAVGTNRATALVLAKDINNITTAAAGTGAVLPAGVVGMELIVNNAGANLIQVYGNGSDTIDGVAGATGVALTNAKRAVFICVAANTFISAQLGVISA